MSDNSEVSNNLGPFQFFILLLSIYVLLALFIQSAFSLPTDVKELLIITDNIICLFFLTDFFIRFKNAENKASFMKWGWIDLLSSIPMAGPLRYGRAFRVIRLLRLLKTIRSTKIIFSYLFKNKMQGTFSLVSSISVLLVIFGSIAMLQLEKGIPESNIQSATDAIWWAFVTITTVGYGDYYPVTTEGRFVAAALMTAGVGLFGTFTGFVASWFLEEEDEDKGRHVIDNLKSDITELKTEISELKQMITELSNHSKKS